MENLVEPLKKIGLSSKEAKLYLSLLKIGDATVKEVSGEAGIKRPTAYLALEELRQKGLLLKIPHAKKAIYRAKDPDELYGYATENVSSLKKVMPRIVSIAGERNPVKTLYYEGLQGLKDAINYRIDEMDGKTMTVFWARLDRISKPVMDLFIKSHKTLIHKKISVIGITPEDSSTELFKEDYPPELYDVDMLPIEDYSSNISLEIVDDFLRIIDGVEMRAVIIEDRYVAEALRQVSDLVRRKDRNK